MSLHGTCMRTSPNSPYACQASNVTKKEQKKTERTLQTALQ